MNKNGAKNNDPGFEIFEELAERIGVPDADRILTRIAHELGARISGRDLDTWVHRFWATRSPSEIVESTGRHVADMPARTQEILRLADQMHRWQNGEPHPEKRDQSLR